MNTNWKAGDKAVCVNDSTPLRDVDVGAHYRMIKDHIYLVTDVLMESEVLYLTLAPDEYNSGMGWLASRFRKLIPATERAELEQHAKL